MVSPVDPASQPLSTSPDVIITNSPKNLPLLAIPPISDLTAGEVSISAEITKLDDRIKRELDLLLSQRETQIESHLSELESVHQDQKIIRALIDVQHWTQVYTGSAKSALKLGLGFLHRMLPTSLISAGSKTSSFFAHLEHMSKLGGVFLTDIENGSTGKTLISKGEILKASHHALDQLKIDYKARKEALKDIQSTLQGEEKKAAQKSHKIELSELKKAIQAFENDLEVEEKKWVEEKIKFTQNLTKTTILSISYVMSALDGILVFTRIMSGAIYSASTVLTLIFSFFSLKSDIKARQTFKKFTNEFEQWKKENTETIVIKAKVDAPLSTEGDAPDPAAEALKACETAIETSRNLLEKRQDIMNKKILKEIPHYDELLPKIKELHASLKDASLKEEKLFNFDDLSVENKKTNLRFYLDHQATIDQMTKNALTEMITKKQKLDAPVIKLKLVESSTFFTLSTSLMAFNVGLWVVGLLTTPIGGLGLLLFGLSVPSLVLTLGFYAASLIHSRKRHPELNKAYTRGMGFKLLYTGLRSAFEEYKLSSLQKKVFTVADIVHQLHLKGDVKDSATYNKALINYENAKKEFADRLTRVNDWVRRLKDLQGKLSKASWKDFAAHADLKIGQQDQPDHQFDTLEAFNLALRECNLDLISTETKELLETHLGMDIQAVQKIMDKKPDLIKNHLQKFFNLRESDYVNFMNIQQKRPAPKLEPT